MLPFPLDAQTLQTLPCSVRGLSLPLETRCRLSYFCACLTMLSWGSFYSVHSKSGLSQNILSYFLSLLPLSAYLCHRVWDPRSTSGKYPNDDFLELRAPAWWGLSQSPPLWRRACCSSDGPAPTSSPLGLCGTPSRLWTRRPERTWPLTWRLHGQWHCRPSSGSAAPVWRSPPEDPRPRPKDPRPRPEPTCTWPSGSRTFHSPLITQRCRWPSQRGL